MYNGVHCRDGVYSVSEPMQNHNFFTAELHELTLWFNVVHLISVTNIKNVKSYPSMLSTYFYQKTIEIILNDERNHVNSMKNKLQNCDRGILSSWWKDAFQRAICMLSPCKRRSFTSKNQAFLHEKWWRTNAKIT
jgi:hypothetical protein